MYPIRPLVYNSTSMLTYNRAHSHPYNTFINPYKNTPFVLPTHPSTIHMSPINTSPPIPLLRTQQFNNITYSYAFATSHISFVPFE